MNRPAPDEEFGVPDEENPEWTEDTFRWSVRAVEFKDITEVHSFLKRRSALLRTAAAHGIDREWFLPFEPNKPGFEDRVARAFEAVLKATRHAAE
jgi:hypothetical protein